MVNFKEDDKERVDIQIIYEKIKYLFLFVMLDIFGNL